MLGGDMCMGSRGSSFLFARAVRLLCLLKTSFNLLCIAVLSVALCGCGGGSRGTGKGVAKTIIGEVRDSQTRQVLEGIGVQLDQAGKPSATTDDAGIFSLEVEFEEGQILTLIFSTTTFEDDDSFVVPPHTGMLQLEVTIDNQAREARIESVQSGQPETVESVDPLSADAVQGTSFNQSSANGKQSSKKGSKEGGTGVNLGPPAGEDSSDPSPDQPGSSFGSGSGFLYEPSGNGGVSANANPGDEENFESPSDGRGSNNPPPPDSDDESSGSSFLSEEVDDAAESSFQPA